MMCMVRSFRCRRILFPTKNCLPHSTLNKHSNNRAHSVQLLHPQHISIHHIWIYSYSPNRTNNRPNTKKVFAFPKYLFSVVDKCVARVYLRSPSICILESKLKQTARQPPPTHEFRHIMCRPTMPEGGRGDDMATRTIICAQKCNGCWFEYVGTW